MAVEVLDSMITVGFLDCVITGAAAIRSPVRPPPRMSTLSLMIDSWISRRPRSNDDPSSLTMSSIFLPATLSPFSAM